MKNLIWLAGLFVVCGMPAQAGQLDAGSVVCISQKYLEKYEDLEEKQEETFLENMRKRVQCVEKKRNTEALQVAKVGEHIQIELPEGFKVWTNADNFSE